MTSEQPARQIPFGRPMIGEDERRAVQEVLSSPQLVHGPRAKAFEQAFADFLGADARATSVASCTAGLHLAYLHLGIGIGDEVLVPAQTHVATAHAVEINGATPVFVDCEANTGNIDVSMLEAAITGRTRAISVVHYLGLPVEMRAVVELARKHHLFVIEDCALALGAALDGTACGLIGDVGVFSFYPVKHLTTAEGGMVVSRHADVVRSIENIKAFGYDRNVGDRKTPGVYDVVRLGLNYRMNEIEAAIGYEQLKKIPGFLRRRRENADTLRAALAGVRGIRVLADGDSQRLHANYCIVAVLDPELGAHRAKIIESMRTRGIGTSVYYPGPVPHTSYYRKKYRIPGGAFPNARQISEHSIALPVGPHLEALDMEIVAEGLKAAIMESRK